METPAPASHSWLLVLDNCPLDELLMLGGVVAKTYRRRCQLRLIDHVVRLLVVHQAAPDVLDGIVEGTDHSLLAAPGAVG